MSDEIRESVRRILVEADISFSATYRGEKKNAFGEGRTMDKWDCEFSRGGVHREFDFYTGIGLRAEPTAANRQTARFQLPGLTENDIQRRTLYGRRYLQLVESMRKPQAPHAAGVLHSLILDSSAAGQSFESWCDEYGYDSDSRKAEATYRACQKNADDLRAVIPMDVLTALETALQDY